VEQEDEGNQACQLQMAGEKNKKASTTVVRGFMLGLL
jgi:hypothetical protein